MIRSYTIRANNKKPLCFNKSEVASIKEQFESTIYRNKYVPFRLAEVVLLVKNTRRDSKTRCATVAYCSLGLCISCK